MSLDRYSTPELLAELGRRMEEVAVESVEFHGCEECTHFKPTHDDRANPCGRGHVMQFVQPEDHNWPDCTAWGFTRTRCRDRSAAA